MTAPVSYIYGETVLLVAVADAVTKPIFKLPRSAGVPLKVVVNVNLCAPIESGFCETYSVPFLFARAALVAPLE